MKSKYFEDYLLSIGYELSVPFLNETDSFFCILENKKEDLKICYRYSKHTLEVFDEVWLVNKKRVEEHDNNQGTYHPLKIFKTCENFKNNIFSTIIPLPPEKELLQLVPKLGFFFNTRLEESGKVNGVDMILTFYDWMLRDSKNNLEIQYYCYDTGEINVLRFIDNNNGTSQEYHSVEDFKTNSWISNKLLQLSRTKKLVNLDQVSKSDESIIHFIIK